MSKLSIVIAARDGAESLERTLLSVLENRPVSTEVLVVLGFDYQDPYHLADEVRFVAAPAGSDYCDCVNLGLSRAAAPIVHLLACGAQVSEFWTERPLDHFMDPAVAGVASLVVDPGSQSVVSAGVDFAASGRVLHCAKGAAAAREELPILGPSRWAAFYRRSAVLDLGGLDNLVGEEFADADLALRLEAAGWKSLLEPRSRVTHQPPRVRRGFSRGRFAERFYLRNEPLLADRTSRWARKVALVAEVVPFTPDRLGQLAGRLAAWSEREEHRRRHRELLDLVQPAQPASSSAADRAGVRIDTPHAQPAAGRDAARSVRRTGTAA